MKAKKNGLSLISKLAIALLLICTVAASGILSVALSAASLPTLYVSKGGMPGSSGQNSYSLNEGSYLKGSTFSETQPADDSWLHYGAADGSGVFTMSNYTVEGMSSDGGVHYKYSTEPADLTVECIGESVISFSGTDKDVQALSNATDGGNLVITGSGTLSITNNSTNKNYYKIAAVNTFNGTITVKGGLTLRLSSNGNVFTTNQFKIEDIGTRVSFSSARTLTDLNKLVLPEGYQWRTSSGGSWKNSWEEQFSSSGSYTYLEFKVVEKPHIHKVCGEVCTVHEDGTAHTDNITYNKLLTVDAEGNLLINGVVATKDSEIVPLIEMWVLPAGNYYINGDLAIDPSYIATREGTDVNLCLNGYKLGTGGSLNTYGNSFTLCDCAGTGVLEGILYAYGDLAIYGGSVAKDIQIKSGSGVIYNANVGGLNAAVSVTGGNLTIYGGVFKGKLWPLYIGCTENVNTTVRVYGGTFSCEDPYDNSKSVIYVSDWYHNASSLDIKIYGGTFTHAFETAAVLYFEGKNGGGTGCELSYESFIDWDTRKYAWVDANGKIVDPKTVSYAKVEPHNHAEKGVCECGYIRIDETTFPDAIFREWVLDKSYGADGFLSPEDISGAKQFDLLNKGISDLTGIEYFTEAEFLNVKGNLLKSIDVSKNTKLLTLNCINNQLTSLDVKANAALVYLYCGNNQLTSLDLSANSSLTALTSEGQIFNVPMNADGKSITLPKGVDPAKVTVTSGATLNGGVLTLDENATEAVYTYATGIEGKELSVTLSAVSRFEKMAVSLGEDISVNYFVAAEGLTAPDMTFTLGEYSETVFGELVGEQYKFTFAVAPHRIGDIIKAELIEGGTVLETKEYSVLQYLNELKEKSSTDLKISDAKYEKLMILVNDLLVYGGAAQSYLGYKTESLVSDGITGTEFTPIESTVKAVADNGSFVTFKSVTVGYSNVNKIRVTFMAEDITELVIKCTVGEKENELKIVSAGEGIYTAETEGIFATGFGESYVFTAYKGETAGASLTYSVNSYVHSMQNKESAIADLAKATYNYGISAKAYAEAN